MPQKKRSQSTQSSSKSRKTEPQESITFSTRLTPEQRDRIVEAAEIRSWTPSNLIRVAALEKAAHILNVSKPTKFEAGVYGLK